MVLLLDWKGPKKVILLDPKLLFNVVLDPVSVAADDGAMAGANAVLAGACKAVIATAAAAVAPAMLR